jgi:hypothetical protein
MCFVLARGFASLLDAAAFTVRFVEAITDLATRFVVATAFAGAFFADPVVRGFMVRLADLIAIGRPPS